MIKYSKLIKAAEEKLQCVKYDIEARDKELLRGDEFTITIGNIVDKITDEKVKVTCSYVLAKVDYPYSQTYRDSAYGQNYKIGWNYINYSGIKLDNK
jgi:hypothetical protein